MAQTFIVVTCSPSSEQFLSPVTDIYREIHGVEPEHKKAFQLAGPNDIFQILADGTTWVLIAKAIATAYGLAIAKKAGDSTWDWIQNALKTKTEGKEWSDEKIKKLVEIVSRASEGHTVVFGFPVRDRLFGTRNAGVALENASPQELLQITAALGLHIDELKKRFEAATGEAGYVQSEINENGSAKVTILEDGSISMVLDVRTNFDAPKQKIVLTVPSLKTD